MTKAEDYFWREPVLDLRWTWQCPSHVGLGGVTVCRALTLGTQYSLLWSKRLACDNLPSEGMNFFKSNHSTQLEPPGLYKKKEYSYWSHQTFSLRSWHGYSYSVLCIVDGLRSFPVYEKQNYRPFCISSCISCPCCSQRWVGGISLYKRLPCWTSIHHHPNGECHVAAEMSYKKEIND